MTHAATKLTAGHYVYRGFHLSGGGCGWRVDGGSVPSGTFQTNSDTEVRTDSCVETSLKFAKRNVDERYEF